MVVGHREEENETKKPILWYVAQLQVSCIVVLRLRKWLSIVVKTDEARENGQS